MISQTTDSASNNDTGFAKLSALISESGITTKWNLSESQIRCLAHIIHLAVMDLLLNIKAIPPDTPLDTPDPMGSINISSEEAEELAPNPATSAEPGLDVDVSVDLSSAFDKVIWSHFHKSLSSYLCPRHFLSYGKSPKLFAHLLSGSTCGI